MSGDGLPSTSQDNVTLDPESAWVVLGLVLNCGPSAKKIRIETILKILHMLNNKYFFDQKPLCFQQCNGFCS